MNLANLSFLWFAVGVAGIAAVLYLLQRLRTRHRRVSVATTLFWEAAAEPAPVRVFTERFRHWLAYLLFLLIATLLWLAFAEPYLRSDSSESFKLLVLDGTQPHLGEDAFTDLQERFIEDAIAIPLDQRAAYFLSTSIVKVLAPGEEGALLSPRLSNVTSRASPNQLPELVRLVSQSNTYPDVTEILVYGRSKLDSELVMQLPPGLSISHVESNVEIDKAPYVKKLGVGHAASGNWPLLDVLIGIERHDESSTEETELEVEVNGAPVPLANLVALSSDSFAIRDLESDGSLVRVRTAPTEEWVELELPNIQPIHVVLDAGVPAAVGAVIRADPTIEVVNDSPDVRISSVRDVLSEVPELLFVATADSPNSILVTYEQDVDAELALTSYLRGLGVDQIDAQGLATALGQELTFGVQSGDERRIQIWRDIVSEDYNFADSSAFPLFVTKAVRWLANPQPALPYAVAGLELPQAFESAPLGEQPVVERLALGSSFVPFEPGQIVLGSGSNGRQISVTSLDNRSAEPDQIDEPLSSASNTNFSSGLPLSSIVLLLVVVFAVFEWVLYQRGLVP